MSNERERLSDYEECRLMVLVDMKITSIKEKIGSIDNDLLTKLLTKDIKELTEINTKLRGQ
jgi:hypothetical protein